ncbi:MAG: ornithine carbamoyltransferase [Euryarchaeota archaeon]|jgi:ornithine carbamoyltransferase|nr:ornithine carbamoyltransferase [Euryarchaeota archaeon]
MSNLLAIDDISEDFAEILEWAITFKGDQEVAPSFTPLDGMSVGSIYEKPSTRTRVSFEVGIDKLGGNALTLLKGDIQLGKSETVGDTAQVLSRYLGAITYRCYAHADVVELAEKSSVPVINALSYKHHPCQAAADLMTIMENKDDLKNVKIAWVGDGNNVLHDLLLAGAILGCDVYWAVPKGYEPDSDVVERAEKLAEISGSKLCQTHDPIEAVTDADVVYTDVFISMGEEDLVDKINDFKGFQINDELVSHAKKDYLFMHCLPAHRGDEVTDSVMDSDNSVVFDQAENRMWAQMSLLTYLIDQEAWSTYSELMEY